jgi:hypothetical protein
MFQELRLKVQAPNGTEYIVQMAKQIPLVVIVGKLLILRVPVVVPLILVVPVIVMEHRRTVWKVTGPDKQVIWYSTKHIGCGGRDKTEEDDSPNDKLSDSAIR